MVMKRILQQLKAGMVGEVIRDYSDLTAEQDGLAVKLKRQGKAVVYILTFSNKENGKASFEAPASVEFLQALKGITNDIKSIRNNGGTKELRLRFRSGQIDLVTTYTFQKAGTEPGQRTAPLNARTFRLLEEMCGDCEVFASTSFGEDENWS